MRTANPSNAKDPEGTVPSTSIDLIVNGDRIRRQVPAHRTLLEFLRYDLGLTGSKQGCDKGDCGACTVLRDGKPVLSCITMAAESDGSTLETVESLARGTELHPLQEEFVRHGAAQCGFCTPGMLMSAKAWLDAETTTDFTRRAIQEALSGNLCRCTGYTKILDAVEEASRRVKERQENDGARG